MEPYKNHLPLECTSSSCASLSRVASSSYVVTSRFVVRFCASSSLYVVVVRCRRQVTKQTVAF